MELQEAVMDRENYTDALEKKADEVEVPRCRNISGDRKHVRTSLATCIVFLAWTHLGEVGQIDSYDQIACSRLYRRRVQSQRASLKNA